MEITIEAGSITVELPPDITGWLQKLADQSGDDVVGIILDRLAQGMDEAEEAA